MYHRKLTFFTTIGSSLEFFDFTIYALLAPYLSKVFFPDDRVLDSYFYTFVVFAAGYLCRPLGSVIFGHLGDRYGRKSTFILTIVIMSFSTFLMGLLPSHDDFAMAPAILLILRMFQGISMGGEVSGSAIFLAEHMPSSRRGSGVAWIFAGVCFGNVLGSLLAFLLEINLSHEQMLLWGWRIPFILGGGLGFFSYLARRNILESPIFLAKAMMLKNHAVPVKTLFKYYWHQVITGVCVTAMVAVAIFTLLYLPSFLSHTLKESLGYSYLYTMVNFSLVVVFTILFGYLSNWWKRKHLVIYGSGIMLFFGYFIFSLLTKNTMLSIWVFSVLFTMISGMVCAVYGCVLIELFPTHVRYTGMSISYNLSFAIFGGISPLANNILQHMFQHFSLYYLMAFAALLTLIAGWCLPDMHQKSLNF